MFSDKYTSRCQRMSEMSIELLPTDIAGPEQVGSVLPITRECL